MKFYSQQQGFTLLEALIVVAIVAIGATIAVPSLVGFVNQTKLNSLKTLLVNDMNTARSEAIKSNVRVIACAANSAATNCATNTNWEVSGWLVCPAAGAACDTTASAIIVRPPVTNGITLAATNASVTFKPIGTALTTAALAQQIVLTGKPGTKSITVNVANTGFVSAQ